MTHAPLWAHKGFWGFIGGSLLLLALTIYTTRLQRGWEKEATRHLEDLFSTSADEPDAGPEETLHNRTFWATGGVVAILLLVHPFVYTVVPIPTPYLVTLHGVQGQWAQAVTGVLIWAPVGAYAAVGLQSAWRFSSQIHRAFGPSRSGDGEPEPSLRELVRGAHTWFFDTLQRAFMMWGLVGGLGLLLLILARDELWIRIPVSAVLALLLASLFLRPLVEVAVWTSRESAEVREQLEARLADRRAESISAALGGAPSPSSDHQDRPELKDALEALPPSNPGSLLWAEILQTLVGLTGPFLSVLYKLFNLVQL